MYVSKETQRALSKTVILLKNIKSLLLLIEPSVNIEGLDREIDLLNDLLIDIQLDDDNNS
jgi:hypothetical protein